MPKEADALIKDCTILILTLIGMREGTFIPLYFLDWIFSAEFLSKLSKLLGGKN